ncbi:MAG: aspartate--tRNA ligase [Spirochaetales bacterium]|nr:aspartate--tRNA ligase [Spirochaetales bacterium]
MEIYRTHKCDELRTEHIEKKVTLAGWIHNRRDHGGVLFLDLRDHYGITQIVVYEDSGFQELAAHLRKETVVQFKGHVQARESENINTNLPTGQIELKAESFQVLGHCGDLPFSVFPEEQAPESVRLKYRYLDLRRSKLHENILLRSRVIASLRRRMGEHGFNELQTPILTASSPEGARDYLVPSRLHPGKFYALPQAPQQYKQLYMMAGFDRYFQIAPCFRDEDARANRSPGEFYQLDIEMSFATQDEIFKILEDVLYGVFTEFTDWKITDTPFPRIPYRESMLKYGTDKPDLRIPLEIVDVTDIFRNSGFNAFKRVIEKGGIVRAINVPQIAGQPRSFFDRMLEFAQSIGSQGLAYLVWNEDEVKGPIAKVISKDDLEALAKAGGVKTGDVMFFVCNKEKEAVQIAGEIRARLGEELNLIEENVYRFCWIVDYPMYEYDPEQKQIIFSHNPFSMPQGGMEALEDKDPLDILAYQYDIVCNGAELSSGAIRNHQPEVMYKAFDIAGYKPEEVDAQFGALINAFKLGAPPHGGIAPGVDRMIMLIANEPNIREVIAFPMNQSAQDLMMDAPRDVTKKQLKELHLKLNLPIGTDSENKTDQPR